MKIKVTITRAEYRQHTFEVEMPDDMDPAQAKADAQDAANEMAYDHDFHSDPSPHSAFYEVEDVEVER